MEKAPMVKTSLGSLTGKVTYVKDSAQPVYTYLGIPYAHPPLGKLRFQRPEPVQPWDGVRDATKPGSPSPQPINITKMAFHPSIIPHDDTSEDCLYLNIYTPGISTDDRRPVVFYIHGGGLSMGMGDMYDGTPLVTFGDVVVVTFNYRLGPMGFLSTGDDACPGNMGLFDQLEALKWINKHISNFGGDPDNVTLFGMSAGSISVQVMLLTPSAKGLFHKAVGRSGSVMLPNMVFTKEESRTKAMTLGRRLGYDGDDTKGLLEFLQGKPIEEINAVQLHLMAENVGFHMSVDGEFLTKYPEELYECGQFNKVPVLLGFAEIEGLSFLLKQLPSASSDTFSEQEAMQYFENMAKLYFPNGLEKVSGIVKKNYFPEDEKDRRQDAAYVRSRISAAVGDMLLSAPAYLWAEYHSEGAPTFLYMFSYRPSYSTMPASVPGATHNEDEALWWGDPFLEESLVQQTTQYTEEEVILSRNIIKYFANFAATGNPNDENLVQWPKFDLNNRNYLEISATPTVKRNPNPQKMALWNKMVKEMLQDLQPQPEDSSASTRL